MVITCSQYGEEDIIRSWWPAYHFYAPFRFQRRNSGRVISKRYYNKIRVFGYSIVVQVSWPSARHSKWRACIQRASEPKRGTKLKLRGYGTRQRPLQCRSLSVIHQEYYMVNYLHKNMETYKDFLQKKDLESRKSARRSAGHYT